MAVLVVLLVICFQSAIIRWTDPFNRNACDRFYGKAADAGVVGASRAFVVHTFGEPDNETSDPGNVVIMEYYPAPWFCLWKSKCGIRLKDGVVVSMFKNSD